jgi:hypothetical protein
MELNRTVSLLLAICLVAGCIHECMSPAHGVINPPSTHLTSLMDTAGSSFDASAGRTLNGANFAREHCKQFAVLLHRLAEPLTGEKENKAPREDAWTLASSGSGAWAWPLVRSLLQAGHRVHAWDTSDKAMQQATAAGAVAVANAKEAFSRRRRAIDVAEQ